MTKATTRDMREHESAEDLWDDDGHWLGPADLGVFLRMNALFAAFWFLVDVAIATPLVATENDSLPDWVSIPGGVSVGVVVWLAFMFGFSRGWIAEGD